ncbi:MAG: hypothetical protein GY765_24065 [bacterium]|nr:hypothetical protein [bacterium]
MTMEKPETLTCQREFLLPLLSARMGDAVYEPLRILVVGGKSPVLHLQEAFPEAIITHCTPEAGFNSLPEGPPEAPGYDYIWACDPATLSGDTGGRLTGLVQLLKPHGLAACAVYGYCGYYGLLMLAAILGKLTAGRDTKAALKISAAVIDDLPPEHPALEQREFIQRLKAHDQTALGELLRLGPGDIFTVSTLLEAVTQWSGVFEGWVTPGLYEAVRQFNKNQWFRHIESMAFTKQAAVSELLTAAPHMHYFLMSSTIPSIDTVKKNPS